MAKRESPPKVGQIFLSCSYDEKTGKVDWTEHHLRTIRKRNGRLRAYAAQKHPWTWGKLSTKHGDFGWLDPIAPMWRDSWAVDDERPKSLGLNKLKAAEYALELHLRYGDADDYESDGEKHFAAERACYERIIARESAPKKVDRSVQKPNPSYLDSLDGRGFKHN